MHAAQMQSPTHDKSWKHNVAQDAYIYIQATKGSYANERTHLLRPASLKSKIRIGAQKNAVADHDLSTRLTVWVCAQTPNVALEASGCQMGAERKQVLS